MPGRDPGRRWTAAELQKAATATSSHIMPINSPAGSYGHIRAADEFGIRDAMADPRDETHWVVFAFNTGEVGTVDSYLLAATHEEKRSKSAIPLTKIAGEVRSIFSGPGTGGDLGSLLTVTV